MGRKTDNKDLDRKKAVKPAAVGKTANKQQPGGKKRRKTKKNQKI